MRDEDENATLGDLSIFDGFPEESQRLQDGFANAPSISAQDSGAEFGRRRKDALRQFQEGKRSSKRRYSSEYEELQEDLDGHQESLAPVAQTLDEQNMALENQESRVRRSMQQLPSDEIGSRTLQGGVPRGLAKAREGVTDSEREFHQKRLGHRDDLETKARKPLRKLR